MVKDKVASKKDIEHSLNAILSKYGYSEEDVNKILNKNPVTTLLKLAEEECKKEYGDKWEEFYFKLQHEVLNEGLEKDNLGE
jgi:hypothetical protein